MKFIGSGEVEVDVSKPKRTDDSDAPIRGFMEDMEGEPWKGVVTRSDSALPA